jgi:hypothetical protein
MKTETDFQVLLKETSKEFSGFYIEKKSDSTLMKFIDLFLKIITFGQMKYFMTDFITTIGTTVYTPSNWDICSAGSKMATIRHERIHMRQAAKWGKIIFSLLYIFCPLPGGLSFFRKKFEQEAYEESLRSYLEYYGPSVFTPGLREQIIKHFTTSEYFWMWPWRSSIEKWYDKIINDLTKSSQ